MAYTKKELTVVFRGEEITIPKGTKTNHVTAVGLDKNYNFISEFDWYKPHLTGFARKMAIHDMVHYGINIEPELLTGIKPL